MRPIGRRSGTGHRKARRGRSCTMEASVEGGGGGVAALAGVAVGIAAGVLQPAILSPAMDAATLALAGLAWALSRSRGPGWRHALCLFAAAALVGFASVDWRSRVQAAE